MRLTGRSKGTRKRGPAEVALDRATYEKELAEGREAGDATKVAQALNNLGTVLTDEVKFILEPSAVARAITTADRLEVDGQTFEVIGPPDARITGSALDYVRARGRRTA